MNDCFVPGIKNGFTNVKIETFLFSITDPRFENASYNFYNITFILEISDDETFGLDIGKDAAKNLLVYFFS